MRGSGQSWKDLQTLAIASLDAALSVDARQKRGECISTKPAVLPPAGKPLGFWVAARPGRRHKWTEQVFYVVDADLDDELPRNRHLAHFARFDRAGDGQELRLELPAETRSALGSARAVRVFARSTFDVKLALAVRRGLRGASRAELVQELWSPQRPPTNRLDAGPAPSGRTLNPEQATAVAALTEPGATFLWGPPGTGKTTVITEAIRDAVASGLSVLIASHTHVAVDNVVEGLIEARGSSAPCAEPGTVIRFASAATQTEVSGTVSSHDHLLISKAVALLTNQVERNADLRGRQAANHEREERSRLTVLIEGLNDVDETRLASAVRAAEAAIQAADARRRSDEADDDRRNLLEAAAADRSIAARSEVPAPERTQAETAASAAQAKLFEAREFASAADAAVATCRGEAAHFKTQRDARAAKAGASAPRGWSPLGAWRHRKLTTAQDRYDLAVEALTAAVDEATEQRKNVDDRRRAASEARQFLKELEERQGAAERATARAESAVLRAGRRSAERDALNASAADWQRTVAVAPDHVSILERAAKTKVLQRIRERDALNEIVAALDLELNEIERLRSKLEGEVRQTQQRLIDESQVMACTVASLALNPKLAARRFDLVVLDEVSSIRPADALYVGARAERSLAFVGDFLQNAPIAEPIEATTDEQRTSNAWLTSDVFALAGIHDRSSAQGHPRCVALRTQYRFPQVIADVVNAFCYDGLLETSERNGSFQGPTITFVSTSRRRDRQLSRAGRSWSSSLGIEILHALVSAPSDTAERLGFVTPYKGQADRAQRLIAEHGLRVDAGTSHRFQGREFDTVILDLMQDDQPRWVGGADLRGNERQVSAAKLLNVGMTRAKRRLYLVGDWDFVRRQRTAGMRALARLEGHPDFELIEADQLLGTTVRL